jgi:hypothetical protein
MINQLPFHGPGLNCTNTFENIACQVHSVVFSANEPPPVAEAAPLIAFEPGYRHLH